MKSTWLNYSEEEFVKLENFCKGYIDFISRAKTERICVTEGIKLARQAGYISLQEAIEQGKLSIGDKVYSSHMDKTLFLFQIGKEDIEKGMNILGAHIDSPRMDVKQNPLYESEGMAYLDTHYYGGIKKYLWVTIPLAVYGVVVKKDGTKVEVNIGDNENDPVFTISDLLIHLSAQQMEKVAAKVVDGEALDLLIGNKPTNDESDAVKAQILKILKENYDIEEDDFLSAELEVVPAGKARECGLDRSMILGYGHDDRSCAYASLVAFLEMQDLDRTASCVLVDKEEVGSQGATGMHSKIYEYHLAEILALLGKDSELSVKRAISNSAMLSSDVSAGFEPLYASAFEKKNSAFLSKGMTINKYTGARGKSGSSDANAEFMAKVRNVLDQENVQFQTCELGAVDVGGGGTIAYIMANYGMDVIDCGMAVLSMHAPFEVVSKADIYETYRGYKAFLKLMK